MGMASFQQDNGNTTHSTTALQHATHTLQLMLFSFQEWLQVMGREEAGYSGPPVQHQLVTRISTGAHTQHQYNRYMHSTDRFAETSARLPQKSNASATYDCLHW